MTSFLTRTLMSVEALKAASSDSCALWGSDRGFESALQILPTHAYPTSSKQANPEVGS